MAALYVEAHGPYPRLVADWWDRERDAKRYSGPYPVIAHPPCAGWSRLRAFSKAGPGDRVLAICALASVRYFGGVLEHPAGSGLWESQKLPRPGDGPDEFGGVTVEVYQGDFGHVAPKRTWLYAVKLPAWPYECAGGRVPGRVQSQHSATRLLTPYPFAEALARWVSGGKTVHTNEALSTG